MQQGFDWPSQTAQSLKDWPCSDQGLAPQWRNLVQAFQCSDVGLALSAKLQQALNCGQLIYPPDPYLALRLTKPENIRVLILGQDPYHGPGQAQGLAFSVPQGVKIPPSLRNIFKELQRSQAPKSTVLPANGSLVRWANQGVLLLNTCLTVQAGQAASHARWGWDVLTDQLVGQVALGQSPVVFMLWGAHAQAKKSLIESSSLTVPHLVLEANHPSPLSAMRPPRPFWGCDHFRLANAFLTKQGLKPIDW